MVNKKTHKETLLFYIKDLRKANTKKNSGNPRWKWDWPDGEIAARFKKKRKYNHPWAEATIANRKGTGWKQLLLLILL